MKRRTSTGRQQQNFYLKLLFLQKSELLGVELYLPKSLQYLCNSSTLYPRAQEIPNSLHYQQSLLPQLVLLRLKPSDHELQLSTIIQERFAGE